MEKLAHFHHERVPERVVHAKGAGAYGTFTVTGDLSRYTRAALLSKVGNQCEVFTRFYRQAGDLFRLTDASAQQRLIDNIVGPMQGVPRDIQDRQVAHFTRADPAYGAGVAHGLRT